MTRRSKLLEQASVSAETLLSSDLLSPIVAIGVLDSRVEVRRDCWERLWASQDGLFKNRACPGCKKTHARKRMGQSLTWIVLEPCGYAGPA